MLAQGQTTLSFALISTTSFAVLGASIIEEERTRRKQQKQEVFSLSGGIRRANQLSPAICRSIIPRKVCLCAYLVAWLVVLSSVRTTRSTSLGTSSQSLPLKALLFKQASFAWCVCCMLAEIVLDPDCIELGELWAPPKRAPGAGAPGAAQSCLASSNKPHDTLRQPVPHQPQQPLKRQMQPGLGKKADSRCGGSIKQEPAKWSNSGQKKEVEDLEAQIQKAQTVLQTLTEENKVRAPPDTLHLQSLAHGCVRLVLATKLVVAAGSFRHWSPLSRPWACVAEPNGRCCCGGGGGFSMPSYVQQDPLA